MAAPGIRLAAHGACRALTEIAVELFPRAGALPRKRVAAGGTLYREGDPIEHLFLVEAGTLRTERVGPNGELVMLSSHGEGDLVGELCFCEVRARQERAVAVDDAQLLVLGVEQMVDLAARDREALVAMMELLCHRVDVARRRLGELGFDSGERRLAMRILDVALSEGTLLERGARVIVRRPSQAAARLGGVRIAGVREPGPRRASQRGFPRVRAKRPDDRVRRSPGGAPRPRSVIRRTDHA